MTTVDFCGLEGAYHEKEKVVHVLHCMYCTYVSLYDRSGSPLFCVCEHQFRLQNGRPSLQFLSPPRHANSCLIRYTDLRRLNHSFFVHPHLSTIIIYRFFFFQIHSSSASEKRVSETVSISSHSSQVFRKSNECHRVSLPLFLNFRASKFRTFLQYIFFESFNFLQLSWIL